LIGSFSVAPLRFCTGLEIFVFWWWRQISCVNHQCTLLVLGDNNLDDSDICVSSLTTTVEPDPEIRDDLADKHADCTGHQASNDTKKRRDDEEAECLVQNVAETVGVAVMTMLPATNMVSMAVMLATTSEYLTRAPTAPREAFRAVGAHLCDCHD
jgi:hypothetical protein